MARKRAGPRRQPANVQVLPSASNVVITGGSFISVQYTYEKEISGQNNSLERLYTRVASNAILNAGGRADEVRCYPGTREEVIGIIEKWIGCEGDPSQSIFWLSGPAGAGKSAIIQTIAERCMQRSMPMANYFFFRADSSRNTAGSVVATLLYQILQFLPALKEKIATLLEAKPLVFDESIQDQFKYLIDFPIRAVVGGSAHAKRLVLLIDGLDECSPETKRVQGDLLRALHYLASEPGSSFVILVASRAEPHLVMTFNEIGSSNDSIFLDENYHPSDDIRLFVVAEFDKIKRNHHLGQTLDDRWPPEAGIEEIVKKASGQFIYAATILRFITNSPASPAHSLEKVRGIRPIAKNSPFAELDAIYTYILAEAEDWELAKDILASRLIAPAILKPDVNIDCLVAPLGLAPLDIQSCLADLVSVVQYNREFKHVVFYHASLQDFLCDASRSKALYIDLEVSVTKLATAHLTAISGFDDVALFCEIFPLIEISTPLLRDTLMTWKPCLPAALRRRQIGLSRLQSQVPHFMSGLRSLFHENGNLFYQAILRKWITWFYELGIPRKHFHSHDVPEAVKFWDDIRKSRTTEKPPRLKVARKRTSKKSQSSMK